MIQIKLIVAILFYSILTYGQVNEPKQITDFDFDSRNPVFLQYPANLQWYYEEPELFFEAITDSLVSICSIKYNAATDSFYQLTYISSNPYPIPHSINRNVNGKFIEISGGLDYKMLLWETNQNGNWDIAFSIDSGNGWTPQNFLFSTPEDELNPSFILDLYTYNYTNLVEILYSYRNSIFLFSRSETEKTEILFQGNDSVNYSSPTGAYSFNYNRLYIVAVEDKNGEDPNLVYRHRSFGDTLWSDEEYVIEGTTAIRPKFTNPDNDIMLSFEGNSDSVEKILLIRPEDFGIPGSAFGLFEDPTIETSEFSAHTYLIVTDGSPEDYYPFTPFSFRFRRNDSTFVRSGEFDSYYYPYSDYYSRVINSKPAIGSLSVTWEGAVSYSIWEDSSNNRINLFGVKRIDPLGIIENNSGVVTKFTLYQNYPNPFNPTTNIKYQIPDLSLVILKVYDVIGNEIATLVNKENPAGSYEVEFNADGLTSGIYYYQLRAGSFVETMKMVLIK